MDNTEIKIVELFPTVVLSAEYNKPINEKILNFVTNQEYGKNLYNVYSKDTFVLKNKIFKKIRKFIQKNLDFYLTNILKPKWEMKMKITQSWLNVSKKAEAHHIHSHPNGYLSGVFYLNTNDNDRINFVRDVNNYSMSIFSENFDFYNSTKWFLPVKSGTLYIFPSTLTHEVPPVEGDKPRISLAFNAFPSGTLGNEQSLTKLTIKVLEK